MDDFKFTKIQNCNGKDGDNGEFSRFLQNVGQVFCLKPVADSVSYVNAQVKSSFMNYTLKSKI